MRHLEREQAEREGGNESVTPKTATKRSGPARTVTHSPLWTTLSGFESLPHSHISFHNNNLQTTVSAANPCLSRPTILFCDFNFRSSLFRRLHYFSTFGFDRPP